jgi:hypothetical protein
MIYPSVANRFWHTLDRITILAGYRKADVPAIGIGLDGGLFWNVGCEGHAANAPPEDGKMTGLTK